MNGKANRDNCNYGNLILSGMTATGNYIIQFSGGSISRLYQFGSNNPGGLQQIQTLSSGGYRGKIHYTRINRLVVVSFLITCYTPAN